MRGRLSALHIAIGTAMAGFTCDGASATGNPPLMCHDTFGALQAAQFVVWGCPPVFQRSTPPAVRCAIVGYWATFQISVAGR